MQEATVMTSAPILRHLAVEDPRPFAPVLTSAGAPLHKIEPLDPLPDPVEPNLIAAMGGPFDVTDACPCRTEEREWLPSDRPPLPLCLGAQLMAAARVAPLAEAEIGFAALAAAGSPGHDAELPVLHRHGRGFALPAGAGRLAATGACEPRGSRGRRILARHVHPEAGMLPDSNRWRIGQGPERAQPGIAAQALRREARAQGPAPQPPGQAAFGHWLRELDG